MKASSLAWALAIACLLSACAIRPPFVLYPGETVTPGRTAAFFQIEFANDRPFGSGFALTFRDLAGTAVPLTTVVLTDEDQVVYLDLPPSEYVVSELTVASWNSTGENTSSIPFFRTLARHRVWASFLVPHTSVAVYLGRLVIDPEDMSVTLTEGDSNSDVRRYRAEISGPERVVTIPMERS